MSSSAFCVHCHSNWFPATTNSNGKPKLIRPGLPPHLNDVWWCEIWFVTWQQQTNKKPVENTAGSASVRFCLGLTDLILSLTKFIWVTNESFFVLQPAWAGQCVYLSVCQFVCVCDICKYLNKHIDMHIKPWLMIEISNNRCLHTLHWVIE